MKFNIVISTQVHENYGAHDWDGKGQCPQYWKAKGGDEYRHPVALDLSEVQDRSKINLLVRELTDAVTRNDDSVQENVMDWELIPAGELTRTERQQIEWYGSVKYPVKAPRILEAAYVA